MEGIIRSQRLHASHASYLNDATELTYARSVIQDVLREESVQARGEASRRFLRDWQTLLDSTPTESDVWVVCFCTEEDLLSQWRGYAGSTGGYAVGFYTPSWLEGSTTPVVLRRIIYDREQQEHWIRSLIGPIIQRLDDLESDAGPKTAVASVPGSLDFCQEAVSECLFCFKHPKFEEEHEWRIVYGAGTAAQTGVMPSRHFRTRGSLIVPYVECILPSSHENYARQLPIFSVVIGPSALPELATKSVVMLLREHGYSDPNVLSSDVPLRP